MDRLRSLFLNCVCVLLLLLAQCVTRCCIAGWSACGCSCPAHCGSRGTLYACTYDSIEHSGRPTTQQTFGSYIV